LFEIYFLPCPARVTVIVIGEAEEVVGEINFDKDANE
jgi:hypothetical protein